MIHPLVSLSRPIFAAPPAAAQQLLRVEQKEEGKGRTRMLGSNCVVNLGRKGEAVGIKVERKVGNSKYVNAARLAAY